MTFTSVAQCLLHLDESPKAHVLAARWPVWVVEGINVPALQRDDLLYIGALCKVGPEGCMAAICIRHCRFFGSSHFRKRTCCMAACARLMYCKHSGLAAFGVVGISTHVRARVACVVVSVEGQLSAKGDWMEMSRHRPVTSHALD